MYSFIYCLKCHNKFAIIQVLWFSQKALPVHIHYEQKGTAWSYEIDFNFIDAAAKFDVRKFSMAKLSFLWRLQIYRYVSSIF